MSQLKLFIHEVQDIQEQMEILQSLSKRSQHRKFILPLQLLQLMKIIKIMILIKIMIMLM